jgi:hypothetical protein
MKLGDLVTNKTPDGLYYVTATSIEEGVSQKNNPKLTISTVTTEGKNITFSRSLVVKALFKIGADLLALGIVDKNTELSDDEDERVRQLTELAHEIEGMSFSLRVETTTNKKTGEPQQEFTILGTEVAEEAGDALAQI